MLSVSIKSPGLIVLNLHTYRQYVNSKRVALTCRELNPHTTYCKVLHFRYVRTVRALKLAT